MKKPVRPTLPTKNYFQIVPFDRLSDGLISVKKSRNEPKMISTKNVKVIKTFMKGQEEEMNGYLDRLRNSLEN